MTCFNSVRVGITRQSICPLTGRVGSEAGATWPDHAPAQLITWRVRNEVLVVVTPLTWPSDRLTVVTGSPEEKSTARFFAVARAAVVRARGSTLRSLR